MERQQILFLCQKTKLLFIVIRSSIDLGLLTPHLYRVLQDEFIVAILPRDRCKAVMIEAALFSGLGEIVRQYFYMIG